MKIACIGEAMIELSIQDHSSSASVGVAGDTLNTAVYLQRALEDAGVQADHSVSYITAVGDDRFSRQIIDTIRHDNINTDLVMQSDERAPGLYAINVDAAGERTFSYWRDQSAARTLFSDNTGPAMSVLEEFDLIYYSAISLAILPEHIRQQWFDFLEGYRKHDGRFVAFDSNYRPRLWDSQKQAQNAIAAATAHCDIALPSCDDEMALFGESTRNQVLDRLTSYGVNRGVLKCGSDGPVDLADHCPVKNLPIATTVIDSTAAGDSFNGAYLAGVVAGHPAKECIARGHECAMRVIGFHGGIVDRSLWQT